MGGRPPIRCTFSPSQNHQCPDAPPSVRACPLMSTGGTQCDRLSVLTSPSWLSCISSMRKMYWGFDCLRSEEIVAKRTSGTNCHGAVRCTGVRDISSEDPRRVNLLAVASDCLKASHHPIASASALSVVRAMRLCSEAPKREGMLARVSADDFWPPCLLNESESKNKPLISHIRPYCHSGSAVMYGLQVLANWTATDPHYPARRSR